MEDENATILGFQYEPRNSKKYAPSSDDSWETYESSESSSDADSVLSEKTVEEWCKCENCKDMATEKESICCHNLKDVGFLQLNDIGCLTKHVNFNPIVLLDENLYTTLVGMYDRESSHLPPRDNVPNKSYRYAAYRQFTWWVHNRLGKSVRKVIPSCVVMAIRNKYPAPDNIYVGYKDGEEASEYDCSWIFHVDDE